MQPTYRVELIGLKVLRVERDADGVGLLLEGNWRIGIWADARIRCAGEEDCEVSRLLWANLAAFTGTSTHEVFRFDNGCELAVSLGTAPSPAESMAIYGPDGTTVVWE